MVPGAFYLDRRVDAVRDFISPRLEDASEFILAARSIDDPQSQFQEWAQSQGHQAPYYITRAAVGPDFLIVTPGIRPAGSDPNEQARLSTPRAAIDAGADRLVIGRPITRADDPGAAARAILEELT